MLLPKYLRFTVHFGRNICLIKTHPVTASSAVCFVTIAATTTTAILTTTFFPLTRQWPCGDIARKLLTGLHSSMSVQSLCHVHRRRSKRYGAEQQHFLPSPTLSHPIPIYPILPHPIPSYPILPYPIPSYSPCPTPYCLIFINTYVPLPLSSVLSATDELSLSVHAVVIPKNSRESTYRKSICDHGVNCIDDLPSNIF